MFTVTSLAEKLGGEVIGDGTTIITGVSPADQAQIGHLTFAEKAGYLEAAETSAASAVLVPMGFESASKILIRVKDPRIAMAKVLPLFFPEETFSAGVHPSAVVDSSAVIHPTAHIGPHCVIGAEVMIGERSVLIGGNHIGRGSNIGQDVRLHPNVVIYSRTQIGNRVCIHSGTIIGADG